MHPVSLDVSRLQVAAEPATITINPDSSLDLTTSPEQWAWSALSPPLGEWLPPEMDGDVPKLLTIEIQVNNGFIGVSLLNALDTQVASLNLLGAVHGRRRISLPLDPGWERERLLLRNGAAYESESSATVYSAHVGSLASLESTGPDGFALDAYTMSAAGDSLISVDAGRVNIQIAPGFGSWGVLSPVLSEWWRSMGLDLPSEDLPIVVNVGFVLESGRVGVALVGDDDRSHKELPFDASSRAQVAPLLVEPGEETCRLLLRNLDESGSPALLDDISVHISALPETVPLDTSGIELDTSELTPGSDESIVSRSDGVVQVSIGEATAAWGAISPSLSDWSARARLTSGKVPGPGVLELTLEVNLGAVGLSLVPSDDQGDWADEVSVIPQSGRVTVRLPVDKASLFNRLLLRNHPTLGGPSRVTIFGSRLVTAPPLKQVSRTGIALDLLACRTASTDSHLAFTPDGSLQFTTGGTPGASSVDSPRIKEWYQAASLQLSQQIEFPCLLTIEAEVTAGEARVGFMYGEDYDFTTEQAVRADSGRRRLSFYVDEAESMARLLWRHCGEEGEATVCILHSVRLVPAEHSRAGLVAEAFSGLLPTGQPLLCVSHSDRVTDPERISLNFLEARYKRHQGLGELRPFADLTRHVSNYQGQVTLWSFENGRWQEPKLVASLRPDFKPQCALWYDDRLWLLGYDHLEIYDRSLEHLASVRDPWLADGHTIAPDNNGSLLISCSSSDALLAIDKTSLQVTRAFRMPAQYYGTNYALERTDSVADHFIPHESQLTHLNSASPWSGPVRRGLTGLFARRRSGVVMSTLIQGAIGWLDASGRYTELTRGFVGCHGVRADSRNNGLYFSDSATGVLTFLSEDGRITGRFDTNSSWLHDSIQLQGDIFAVAVTDRNVVEIHNVETKELLATLDGRAFGQGPQFLTYGV